MEPEHRDRDSEPRIQSEETQGIKMVFVNATNVEVNRRCIQKAKLD